MQKVLALIGLFSYPLVVRVHLPNVGEESEWKVQPLQNFPCLASKNSLLFPCHEIRHPNPLQRKNPENQPQRWKRICRDCRHQKIHVSALPIRNLKNNEKISWPSPKNPLLFPCHENRHIPNHRSLPQSKMLRHHAHWSLWHPLGNRKRIESRPTQISIHDRKSRFWDRDSRKSLTPAKKSSTLTP